jgi:hypothetical protein
MNEIIKRLIFFDKATTVITLAIIACLILAISTFIHSAHVREEIETLKSSISGIQSKSPELIRIKSIVDLREKKMERNKSRGIIAILEQTMKDLNLHANALKPMEKKKVIDLFENNAELIIESIDLNSIVNLLYRIENSTEPLKIKKASIKTTFENTDKFRLELILSLMSKK